MSKGSNVLNAAGDNGGDAIRVCASGTLSILAAAGDPKQLRRFAMEAYNGGPMLFDWSEYPVVVDLSGLEITAKSRPILKDHEIKQVVGHSDQIVNDGKTIQVQGTVSGVGAAAQEVVASSDNGFPWQASIGVRMVKREMIPAGVAVTVNAQNFTGPLLIVRQSILGEISFVPLGADDSTQARMIAALSSSTNNQGNPMDFTAWLAQLGFDSATLTDAQKAALQKAYEADQAAAKAAADKAPDAPAKATASAKLMAAALAMIGKDAAAALQAAAKGNDGAGDDADAQALKASRALQAGETTRVAEIRKLCAAGKHSEIEAKAISEGWTKDKTELEVLRASRITAPNVGTGAGRSSLTAGVIEAGMLLAARADQTTLKKVKEQDLDAAHSHFRGDLSLGAMIFAAAYANGYCGHSRKVDKEVLRAAFNLQASGYSTVDIAGILSNVANKMLLEGFFGVEAAWRLIASISPASDFKTMTRYRLTGAEKYEKVAPGGEIKHGTLGEESYTNKVDTYALMLAITRNDLINDDLGALSTIPRKLGRGAGLKLNQIFWAEFLDDANFFNTDNSKKNYLSGATTNLSIAGLNQAVTKFRRQVDANGNPIGVEPRVLLVPPELEGTQAELNRSVTVNTGGASSKDQVPNANIYAGRFAGAVSQYLTAAKVWYLLADPRDLAVMDVSFLNGQESPTVESAEADFNTLGVQMRGYHDFGVAKAEYRGGVKVKGEA